MLPYLCVALFNKDFSDGNLKCIKYHDTLKKHSMIEQLSFFGVDKKFFGSCLKSNDTGKGLSAF